jgi:disease resistance protein RPM1
MAAAAIVSVSMGVMKPVLTKLATLMGDEYKKIKGRRKDVTFLWHELSAMDALLESMNNADELDLLAKNWRKDIIEMSYTIENYIDDFMHHLGEKADDDMCILRKALEYLRTFCDCRRIANQFQEIKTLVMEASERRNRYKLDQCISITTPVVVDPRISVLYKESANLVRIDAQKNELLNWAMEEVKTIEVYSNRRPWRFRQDHAC